MRSLLLQKYFNSTKFCNLVFILWATLICTFNCVKNDETMSSFERNIKITYKRAAECIKTLRRRPIKIPSSTTIINHYDKLLEVTAQYRGLQPHRHKDYKGPWIENYFISTFMSHDITYFNGFVPLFVQWSDYDNIHGHDSNATSWLDMFKPLVNELRSDIIYVVISQANYGFKYMNIHFPNAIVMNAGGDGDIAIPLIKDTLRYIPPVMSQFNTEFSFYGSVAHGKGRIAMINELQTALKKPKFNKFKSVFMASKHWIQNVSTTVFNLAPRGYGRGSFRLSEIIQIGRIPVLIYDDFPWIPYDYPGSQVSVWALGYVAQTGRLEALLDQLAVTPATVIAQKLALIEKARHLYTYEGVMEEVDAFFRMSGSANHTAKTKLVCSPYQYDHNELLAEMLDVRVDPGVLR